MRNYIAKRDNFYKLPHDIYMQMFYILRDYGRIKECLLKDISLPYAQIKHADAIGKTQIIMEHEYKKRTDTYGALDSYRAFFDYCYFSYMYARKKSDSGASKSAWSLYKSKFAYTLAHTLELV